MIKQIIKIIFYAIVFIKLFMAVSGFTIVDESYEYEIEHLEDTTPTNIVTTTVSTTTATKVTTTTKKKTTTKKANSNGKYKITHYGPDCKGCSGITASGYNVNNTIYYNDKEYGQVRIVATSKSIPLYSIIKIHNYNGEDTLAIVLDRGVSGNVIDLLVENEKVATKYGVKRNVDITILRRGK